MSQAAKLLFEIGPLVVFFVANGRYGIFPATAAFMVAIVIAVPASWWLERRAGTTGAEWWDWNSAGADGAGYDWRWTTAGYRGDH